MIILDFSGEGKEGGKSFGIELAGGDNMPEFHW